MRRMLNALSWYLKDPTTTVEKYEMKLHQPWM